MGKVRVGVTESVIRAEDILIHLDQKGHGAYSLFLGVVRNLHLGKRVFGVSYDIFKPLAERIFAELCAEAQTQWGPDLDAVVFHRTGRLQVQEVSVGIGVSSPHRAENYLASQYIIDQLKVRAPIWKQEHYEDGNSEWLPGHVLCRRSH